MRSSISVFRSWARSASLRLPALLLIAGCLSVSAPASAKTCTQHCLTPGDKVLTILVDTLPRIYYVHVPAGYTGTDAVPLVLDLHGFSRTALLQRSVSGQLEESDKRNFIAVWPEGIGTSWHAYDCCSVALATKVDDVKFLRQVIGALKGRANIDADRVYVTGLSNGGAMTQRMACEAADIVHAAAAVSFPLNTDSCHPAKPLSVITFQSTGDKVVPYDGGTIHVTGVKPFDVPSAKEGLAKWAAAQHCSTGPATAALPPKGTSITRYTACDGGKTVSLVTMPSDKHIPYQDPAGMPDGETIAAYMWDHVFK